MIYSNNNFSQLARYNSQRIRVSKKLEIPKKFSVASRFLHLGLQCIVYASLPYQFQVQVIKNEKTKKKEKFSILLGHVGFIFIGEPVGELVIFFD